jgi:diacylglycerol kinase family enzyme
MKALVLLNESAGTLAGLDAKEAKARIERGFSDAGAEVEVRFVNPGKLADVARDALDSDLNAIIGGGGDGTINTIANAIIHGHKPFGVLPLGTHNHFAKDLNVPLGLDDAIRALANGTVSEIPVAEVNGRIFVNFSAIGLHPRVVLDRESQRQRTGRGKMPATMFATARQLLALPVQRVSLSSRGHTFATRTPSVIICNNPHQMKVFGVENASVPERGLLNVYVTTRPTRRTLLWQLLRAATNNIHENTRNLETMALPEMRIDSRRRHVAVSIDGEVVDLKTPLRYRIHERPLKVLVPGPIA